MNCQFENESMSSPAFYPLFPYLITEKTARSDTRSGPQTVEKPFLKVKLHKREKERFWSSLFYVVNMFTTACRISIP